MKQPIDPKDVRKGDLIRQENVMYGYEALEYRADSDGYARFRGADTYLLDRPEPPFEPYWGMVIQNPNNRKERAIYLPDSPSDQTPWLVNRGDNYTSSYVDTDWARARIAEGWVIVSKQEEK